MESGLQAILAAMASFLIVSLILFVILLICKGNKERRRRRDSESLAQTLTQTSNRTVPKSELSSLGIGSNTFDPSLSCISMPELLLATKNFAPELIIGDGSFGLVYKATLSSGVTVAVKKLSPDAFQGFREFRAEMDTLGKIKHENIVKILGYYSSGWDRVLIYEFIKRGSLDQWLYDTTSSSRNDDVDSSGSSPRLPLSWGTRANIVKGVAKGLAHMHNLETPIIHRDIKASNVLLDSNFEAHIADFGLARRIEGSHLHVSTQVAGTMGYMPPEYVQGAPIATMMGDVYSFGILMLEIITVRRPNWPFPGEDGKEVRLIQWVRTMVAQNRQMDMLDASISRDGLKTEWVVEYFSIADLCTNEACKSRPTMNTVLELLDGVPM